MLFMLLHVSHTLMILGLIVLVSGNAEVINKRQKAELIPDPLVTRSGVGYCRNTFTLSEPPWTEQTTSGLFIVS